jgi:hypothetical protein
MKNQSLVKLIFLCLIGLVTSNAFAQSLESVQIKSKGGYFESSAPWGTGTIGVIATQYYAVIPKSRSFQYFNDKGELEWKVKVKPFNFNNTALVNGDSKFCYFINMPFGKTAILEQKSKSVFLNIYQINKSGTLKEKALSYSDRELSGLKAYMKNMEPCYIGAYDDGLIFVSTNDSKNYHVIKIGGDFKVSYQLITLEWDDKLYKDGQLSRPIYVMGASTFYIIQTKIGKNEIDAKVKQINLTDFSTEEMSHSLDLKDYNLYATPNIDDYHVVSSMSEELIMSHNIYTGTGNVTYITPSLGAFTHYEEADGKLKCYSYYRNTGSEKKSKQGEGFLIYNIDNDVTNAPQSIFEFRANKSAAKSYALEMLPSGEFVFFTKESKKKLSLKTSNGKEMEFTQKSTIIQAFASYLVGVDEISTDLDRAYLVNGKFVFVNVHGKNIHSNYKKLTIYRQKE